MTARVFSVTVVSPLELIRTKMQSQKLSYYGESLLLMNMNNFWIWISNPEIYFHRCRKSVKRYDRIRRCTRHVARLRCHGFSRCSIFRNLLGGLRVNQGTQQCYRADVLVQFLWRGHFWQCESLSLFTITWRISWILATLSLCLFIDCSACDSSIRRCEDPPTDWIWWKGAVCG